MNQPLTAAVRFLSGEREPVRVATTGNLSSMQGLLVIDDVELEVGDRVLVKDQIDATKNGIWLASEGIWFRAPDASYTRAINEGVTVAVREGTANNGKTYRFSSVNPIVGTDPVTLTYFLSDTLSEDVSDAAVAAVQPFVDRAESAALYVTGVDTVSEAEGTAFSDTVKYLQLLGRDAYGDGGSFKAVEITEDDSPLGPGQFKTNVNLKRWENAEDVITPAMFADFGEMLTFTKAQMRIPAGNYEFNEAITVRDNAVIRAEKGAAFIPTFEPAGVDRATPLIDFGNGADINYVKLQLDAGINTIRKGFRIGDNAQIGYIECTSSDLNNNRTEPGSTDLISGAVLIDGDHVRIGQIYLNRFDRGWCVVDSTDVIIGKIRNLETVMGGYVHGTRDLHVLAGYTTGPTDPTLPNPFGRGVMTPGANSLVLAGCADSSFSNWSTYDMLEHGLRVGAVASGTSVPNHRLSFVNHKHVRPYGCGHKHDDADVFNIKHVLISGLYTQDVGNGNWFGTVGYTNWSSGGVDNPASDNDGNKVACAIRNSQYVTVHGFMNRAIDKTHSGYIGFWVERSNHITASFVDTEKARTSGIQVQSGGSTAAEEISIIGRTSDNTGDGVKFDASASDAVWRGVVVDVDSQDNGGYDFNVTANLSGTSPYATKTSRIRGFALGGTSGIVNIATVVLADADFVDEVRSYGTFTPSITFATPGDLALSSVTASGTWRRDGRYVRVESNYTGTPTFTTASGNLRLTGLPFAAASGVGNLSLQSISSLVDWNSRTMLSVNPTNANTFCEVRGFAAAGSASPMQATEVTSGAALTINYAGEYRI